MENHCIVSVTTIVYGMVESDGKFVAWSGVTAKVHTKVEGHEKGSWQALG